LKSDVHEAINTFRAVINKSDMRSDLGGYHVPRFTYRISTRGD